MGEKDFSMNPEQVYELAFGESIDAPPNTEDLRLIKEFKSKRWESDVPPLEQAASQATSQPIAEQPSSDQVAYNPPRGVGYQPTN